VGLERQKRKIDRPSPQKEEPEKIEWPALRINGTIYRSITHGDAWERAVHEHPEYYDEGVSIETGFLTTKNRFVDRKEALRIAEENSQLIKRVRQRKKGLHSSHIFNIPGAEE
jgi:hypothetical protein